MSTTLRCLVCACLGTVLLQSSLSAEGGGPWTFSASLSAGYNDNRDGTKADKESQIQTRLTPRVDFNAKFDRGDVDLYYSPVAVYRTNARPDQESPDVYHGAGVVLNWRTGRRMRFSLSDSFVLDDTPVDMVSERTFQEYVTYLMNRVGLTWSYELIPGRSIVSLKGHHMAKRYREDAYAAVGDEGDVGGGVMWRYVLRSGMNVFGDVSYRQVDLGTDASGAERAANILFAGGGAEKVFGRMTVRGRAGMDRAVSSVAMPGYRQDSSRVTPAGDVEFAYSPSDATRLGFTAAYHASRSDVYPFAEQKRMSLVLSAAHDFTKRISGSLQCSYAEGTYDDLVFLQAGGKDTVMGAGIASVYRINRNWALEASYRYEDWSSDASIREPHSRNLAGVAAKARF